MDIEFQSVEEIRLLQEHLLSQQIAYVSQHSPYYKRMFAALDIDVKTIKSIVDLQKLPLLFP